MTEQMTVTCKIGDSFANGFDYFCVNCGHFFSVQIMDSIGNRGSNEEISFCPKCGEDILLNKLSDLLKYCVDSFSDTINFFSAFPPDEPLPYSRTGATPRQVEWIIGCVISDRGKNIPVTIESLASQLDYDPKIVAAVFKELHL